VVLSTSGRSEDLGVIVNDPSSESLSRARAAAKRLLLDFRGSDPERAHRAAVRLTRLRSFASESPTSLLAARSRVRLKHALAVVASEQGASSWLELKRGRVEMPTFHTPRMSTLLNRWFVEYHEARASRDELGGYLLPFRNQLVVTESEGIRELGLDPEDPDWAAIGFDLVQPGDRPAFERLCAKRREAIADGVGVPTAARPRAGGTPRPGPDRRGGAGSSRSGLAPRS